MGFGVWQAIGKDREAVDSMAEVARSHLSVTNLPYFVDVETRSSLAASTLVPRPSANA